MAWLGRNRLCSPTSGGQSTLVQIRALDPFDDVSAGNWYAAMYAGASAGRVAPPVVGAASELTSLRTNDSNKTYDRRAYGAWDGDACLGTVLVALPRNGHVAEVDVNVPPSHRGRGIGSALFAYARTIAETAGVTTITDEINVPDGALDQCDGGRFALAHGFASCHTESRLMLDLPVRELDALESYALEKASGYRVVAFDGLTPPEHLDALARMMTLMQLDVPIGERDYEPISFDADRVLLGDQRSIDQGYGRLKAMVLDQAGEPAAYTLMLVGVDRRYAVQDDTFVLRAHRGHRLGTLAKVANLRQLAAHHPGVRHVHTWMADENNAMRSINQRFGFRPVEAMHNVELSIVAAKR